jgi:hypothetical protein
MADREPAPKRSQTVALHCKKIHIPKLLGKITLSAVLVRCNLSRLGANFMAGRMAGPYGGLGSITGAKESAGTGAA